MRRRSVCCRSRWLGQETGHNANEWLGRETGHNADEWLGQETGHSKGGITRVCEGSTGSVRVRGPLVVVAGVTGIGTK